MFLFNFESILKGKYAWGEMRVAKGAKIRPDTYHPTPLPVTFERGSKEKRKKHVDPQAKLSNFVK